MLDNEQDAMIDAMIDEMIAEIKANEVEWSQTVQVGDWVDCSMDAYYLSGPQYKTKDKLYQVREVDIRTDRETGEVYSRTVIVDGDYLDPSRKGQPENVWLGDGRVIVRNGKVIWENRLQKEVKALLANPPEDLSPDDIVKLQEIVYHPDLSVIVP